MEVKTDETTQAVIVFNTGYLTVSGRNSDTSQKPVGTEWDIYPIRNGKVSDKYIAYSYDTPANFTLPAGKYRINASYGGKVYTMDAVVKRDQKNNVVVPFN